MMNKQKALGILCCFLAALFWGIAFVAQDKGAVHVESFTFQAVRSFIGAIALVPVFLLKDRIEKKKGIHRTPDKKEKKMLLLGGLACGVVLCVAACLQQFGIANNETSPGKDAFITALYMLFVPVIGLFLGKRARPHVYLCIPVALLGLWLLCMNGSTLSVGDVQVILCSVVFSFHILVVDHVAPHVDGVRLSCIQFFTVGVLSSICMLLFESPTWEGILTAAGPLLYAGVMSCAGAYTLQIIGQQHTPPTAACMVLSLESVFAVLASMVMLGMFPSGLEILGMVLIFAAVIVSQLPLPGRKQQKKQP